MSLSEILSFIKTLLQSEAEVIAAFLTGVICTVMGVFVLRKWIFPRRDAARELDRLKAKLVSMEKRLRKRNEVNDAISEKRKQLQDVSAAQEEIIARLRDEQSKLVSHSTNGSSLAAEYVAVREHCAQLEHENSQLVLDKQSLEKTIQKLQTDLATVETELAHSAKWLKVFEENARFSESGSLAES